MKIKITFKDPDAVFDAVDRAARSNIPKSLGKYETEMLAEFRHSEIGDRIARWVDSGEYLTVEFDLEAGTARVEEVA